MSFSSELEAFRAYAKIYPEHSVFLIDTYDTLKSGIKNAIIAGKELAAKGYNFGVRLDSGDISYLSTEVRKALDAAGLPNAKISKNDAAEKIAALLGASKPVKDKVFSTSVYRFDVAGEEWVTIGLRGHILEPDFAPTLVYKKSTGWRGVTAEGESLAANVPADLAKPPYKTKRKPFLADGVELKTWKMDALPYLVYAPIEKLPKEKDIIRSAERSEERRVGKECRSRWSPYH